MGRWVADRPIRCTGCAARCSSRSRVSARCEPRLLPATAWISSTITVAAGASIARVRSAVTSRYSDSGVVIRKSGGRFSIAARSAAAVSPVRTATRMSGAGRPIAPRPSWRSPPAGARGSARCRRPAPSAATRTRPAARPGARGPARRRLARARGRSGRCRPGTRPASSRNRSARRSAYGARPRSPPSPRLRLGRAAREPPLEPASNSRVERLQHLDILSRNDRRGIPDRESVIRPDRSRRTPESSSSALRDTPPDLLCRAG